MGVRPGSHVELTGWGPQGKDDVNVSGSGESYPRDLGALQLACGSGELDALSAGQQHRQSVAQVVGRRGRGVAGRNGRHQTAATVLFWGHMWDRQWEPSVMNEYEGSDARREHTAFICARSPIMEPSMYRAAHTLIPHLSCVTPESDTAEGWGAEYVVCNNELLRRCYCIDSCCTQENMPQENMHALLGIFVVDPGGLQTTGQCAGTK